MRFINVKFSDGLGNQLFQYAAARGLLSKGDRLILNMDSYKSSYLDRRFTLRNYNIKGKEINNKYAKKIFVPSTKLNALIDFFGLYALLKEQGFLLHRALKNKMRLFNTIEGYWQSEFYFKHIREELLSEFTPARIPEVPHYFLVNETVAVHVRRTDYLKDDRYGFLGESYYRDAIAFIRRKISTPLFIFFSDDLEWCRNQFKDLPAIFFSDKNWEEDYLQLHLMSLCRHQIIANSSYSWWGAWLNTNQDKIVIRPEKPFKDNSLYYEAYYPDEWIKQAT